MKSSRTAFCLGFVFVLTFQVLSCGVRAPNPAPFNKVSSPINSWSSSPSEILAELQKLQPPEGVDSSILTQIKEELSSLLRQRKAFKLVSRPPLSQANRVQDLEITDNGDGTYTLSWTYRNIGDYNQDGVVNIMDIFPLADSFFKRADSTNFWIDGNLDGEINIGDVFPLADNFFTNCSGYFIEASASREGDFEVLDEVPFSPGSGAGAVKFERTLTATPGHYVRVTPFDSSSVRGEEGAPQRLPGSGNEPPNAVINADVTEGDAPLLVNFDGTASSDSDGTIIRYEWDFEGDGIYDEDTGTTPTSSHTYIGGGVYSAKLRVTDDDDLTHTASVTIVVSTKLPPVISVTASQTRGSAPLLVSFDASASTDPDGGALSKFEWDWDGDGTYDFDAGSYPWASHMYSEGNYTTVLRVTDDEGSQSTRSLSITAVALTPVTSTFDVEWSPDVTLIDGENLGLLWDIDFSDPENYMFLFDAQGVESAGLDMSPGRILVVAGVALRRVTAVEPAGTAILVSTEYATLNEAIPNGTISWDYPVEFTPDKIASFIINGKEVSADGNVIHFEMEFGNYKYLVDVNLQGDTAQFKFVAEKKLLEAFRGNFTVEGTLQKFSNSDHIVLSGGELADFDHALNGLQGNATLSVGMLSSGNDAINFEFPATIMKIPFTVGPIPVVLNVKIQFVMNCVVPPNSAASLKVHFTYDSDLGFNFDGVEVNPGGNVRSENFDKDGEQAVGALPGDAIQVSAGVGFPRVELGIFGETLVPWAQIAYLIGGGYSTFPQCQNVEAGFIMNAGYKLGFLGIQLLEGSFNPPLYKEMRRLIEVGD